MSDDSYVFEGPADPPAPRDNNPPLSISDLSFALKRTLEERFGHVRLRGEISKVNRHASGHVYLTLKDDKAAIDGVVWKGAVRGLGVQRAPLVSVHGRQRITLGLGRAEPFVAALAFPPVQSHRIGADAACGAASQGRTQVADAVAR